MDELMQRAAAVSQRAAKFRPVLAVPDVKEAAAIVKELAALVELLAARDIKCIGGPSICEFRRHC